MKVLYLSEWYPHRYDAMMGLFVQKHAIAVARQGVDVCVFYLHRDTRISQLEITDNTHSGVREIIVYYPSNYLAALRKGHKYVYSRVGHPDICQLNVITKNALLPLWLKLRYGIPYIIVEHWSGYLPENGQYMRGTWLYRQLAQIAVRYSSHVLTVSQRLTECMRECGLKHPHYGHINNVVDDFFFKEQNIKRTKQCTKTLLHISCFDERAKNVCGLLRAVKKVAATRQDFKLTIVGTGVDFAFVSMFAQSLGLTDDFVTFTGELPPAKVAEQFESADIFVLFSNYETAGVVLCESIVCGKPIISTPVGVAPQIVNDKTGILVPIGDEQQLAQSIQTMLDHYQDYDAATIRQTGQQYTFEVVGKQLLSIYQNSLCRTSL